MGGRIANRPRTEGYLRRWKTSALPVADVFHRELQLDPADFLLHDLISAEKPIETRPPDGAELLEPNGRTTCYDRRPTTPRGDENNATPSIRGSRSWQLSRVALPPPLEEPAERPLPPPRHMIEAAR